MSLHVWACVLALLVLVAWAARPAEGSEGSASRPVASQSQPAATALRALGQKHGVLVGVAAAGRLLAEPESPYARTIARECGIITPENDMKFGPLRPGPDTWNWARADALVHFAGKHGIKVHGHTLVWHQQLPDWVTSQQRSAEQCRELMLGHIEAVVGRWRGRIHAWDVVNEAIDKDGTFRRSYWMDGLGEGYVELAFRKAHEVDPRAKLVYNDFGIEGSGTKSDAAYALIKGMKQGGVPIDAVGFQCHWEVGNWPPLDRIRANVKRFADLGVDVWITEMDLRVKVPATPQDLATQAQEYAALVRAFLATGAVRAIQTWGLDDGHSWVPHFFEGYGDALLFDRDLQPKPAYFAAWQVLNESPDAP